MDGKCNGRIVKWLDQPTQDLKDIKEKGLWRCGMFAKTSEYIMDICEGHMTMVCTQFEQNYCHDSTCLYRNHSQVPNTLPIDSPKPGHIINLEESNDYWNYCGLLIPVDSFDIYI